MGGGGGEESGEWGGGGGESKCFIFQSSTLAHTLEYVYAADVHKLFLFPCLFLFVCF